MNPKTMFKLTYGLFVLTSKFEGKDSGCIINTAGQVTAEPNRISITVNKSNFTHDLVKSNGQFNISILSEQANFSHHSMYGRHCPHLHRKGKAGKCSKRIGGHHQSRDPGLHWCRKRIHTGRN